MGAPALGLLFSCGRPYGLVTLPRGAYLTWNKRSLGPNRRREMRVKLGTLKRIIREAVEAELNEVWRPDKEIEATRLAAEQMPFRNPKAELAVAADRERQERHGEEVRARAAAERAAWPSKNEKYLAVLDELERTIGADPAFKLKIDVMEHPGLTDPNMTVKDVAASVAAAAASRGGGSKYDRRYSR